MLLVILNFVAEVPYCVCFVMYLKEQAVLFDKCLNEEVALI